MTSASTWVRLFGDLDGMIVIADALAWTVKAVASVLLAVIRTPVLQLSYPFRRLFKGSVT